MKPSDDCSDASDRHTSALLIHLYTCPGPAAEKLTLEKLDFAGVLLPPRWPEHTPFTRLVVAM